MSDLTIPNISSIPQQQEITGKLEGAYDVASPHAELRKVAEEQTAGLDKTLEERTVAAKRAEDKANLLSKQKEILGKVNTFFQSDKSKLPFLTLDEPFENQKARVHAIQEKLLVPQKLREFINCMVKVLNATDNEKFDMIQFIAGLNLDALDVLLDEKPGREIYLEAAARWDCPLSLFMEMMHSPKFRTFHAIITREVPKIHEFIQQRVLYLDQGLWDLFHVLIYQAVEDKSVSVTSDKLQAMLDKVGVTLLVTGSESTQLTALHLLGAALFGDLAVLPKGTGTRVEIYKFLTPQGNDVMLDIDYALTMLKGYQTTIETCKLFEAE